MEYKIEREVVRVVKEVTTYLNYAVYILTLRLHECEDELESMDTEHPYRLEVETKVKQLKESISATKDYSDLPF